MCFILNITYCVLLLSVVISSTTISHEEPTTISYEEPTTISYEESITTSYEDPIKVTSKILSSIKPSTPAPNCPTVNINISDELKILGKMQLNNELLIILNRVIDRPISGLQYSVVTTIDMIENPDCECYNIEDYEHSIIGNVIVYFEKSCAMVKGMFPDDNYLMLIKMIPISSKDKKDSITDTPKSNIDSVSKMTKLITGLSYVGFIIFIAIVMMVMASLCCCCVGLCCCCIGAT